MGQFTLVTLPSIKTLDKDLASYDSVLDLLKRIYPKQKLAARVKAVINLREFITKQKNESEAYVSLKAQLDLFLSCCFNTFDEKLETEIQSFLSDFAAGSKRVTPLNPELPYAKALAEWHAQKEPKTPLKELKEKYLAISSTVGEVSFLRSKPQLNDYQCGATRLKKIERDTVYRVLPICSTNFGNGLVKIELNGNGELSIVSFSSEAYKDVSNANGCAMFNFTEDGAIYVGSRRDYADNDTKPAGFFHSALSRSSVNIVPQIICGGLLMTDFYSEQQPNYLEPILVMNNCSGHFSTGPAGMKLLIQFLDKHQVSVNHIGLNIRPWPPGSVYLPDIHPVQRIHLQAWHIAKEDLLTATWHEFSTLTHQHFQSKEITDLFTAMLEQLEISASFLEAKIALYKTTIQKDLNRLPTETEIDNFIFRLKLSLLAINVKANKILLPNALAPLQKSIALGILPYCTETEFNQRKEVIKSCIEKQPEYQTGIETEIADENFIKYGYQPQGHKLVWGG